MFAAAKLDGAVIGGLARNHWAVPRTTFDLDLTVVANAPAIAKVVASFAEAGFKVMRQQEAGSPSGPDFVQLYNPDTHQVVEFQTAKTEYQELLIERAIPLPALAPLRVVTLEDLVVLKLLAFRRKDQDDLREVAEGHTVDWAYIEHWANIWKVQEQLATLRGWLAHDAANSGLA